MPDKPKKPIIIPEGSTRGPLPGEIDRPEYRPEMESGPPSIRTVPPPIKKAKGGKIANLRPMKISTPMNPMNAGEIPPMGGGMVIPRYNSRAIRPGGMAAGGSVRGSGCAVRGKTKGRMV